MRAPYLPTWVSGLVLATAALSAQADIYQFDFTGQVTFTDQSLVGVDVGTPLSGRFTYDTALEPSSVFGGSAAIYNMGADITMSIALSDYNFQGGYAFAFVVDGVGSNEYDSLTIGAGDPSFTQNGVAVPNGVMAISLSSKVGNTGVLSGVSLPTSIDVSAFDSDDSNLTYGEVRLGGNSLSAVRFQVNSIKATLVPEPGTLAMMGLGLLALRLVARRRR